MKTSFSGDGHDGFITTDEPVKTDRQTADAPYAPPSAGALNALDLLFGPVGVLSGPMRGFGSRRFGTSSIARLPHDEGH